VEIWCSIFSFLCSDFYTTVCPCVHFLLAILLSVLRFTASENLLRYFENFYYICFKALIYLREYHTLQGDNFKISWAFWSYDVCMQISSISVIKTAERKAAMWLVNLKLWVCWLEFVKMLIFITVDIFKHTAKKIRKLKEQIKFYLKCMVPP
jgi:hypothetical protein